MTTETEIVNAALRKVSGRRIDDISESIGSAGIARDILASERDELLRSGTWNFATIRVVLAQLTTPPAFGFQYAYGLPADFARVISVYDNDGGYGTVPYKMETVKQVDGTVVQAILSNASTLYLRYVRLLTDINLMGPSFRQALVLRLARVFAISVAESNSLYAQIDKELDAAARHARAVDGIEDYPDRLPEGSWVTSRSGYGRQRGGW